MIKRRRSVHHVFMTQSKFRALLRAYHRKVYLDRLVASLVTSKWPSWLDETRNQMYNEIIYGDQN